MYMHVNVCIFRRYTGVLDTLELEVEAFVRHLRWMLGPELWSSVRAVSTPNCQVTSPAP